MPKTAIDPLFATQRDPASAGRHGKVVTPNDTNDLTNVSSSLILTTGSSATGVTVIFADDADSQTTLIPLPSGITVQLLMQVRRVMATGTNLGTGTSGVVASWG